jgi:hypothetical protein
MCCPIVLNKDRDTIQLGSIQPEKANTGLLVLTVFDVWKLWIMWVLIGKMTARHG